MNVLYPAFLLGALAVAIPVVLHFLRRDVAPDVPFTAVRLLQNSPVERSRRRRLRDLLLLAARVAALLLLATAFARPYASGAEAAAAGLRIVAVDRSFSMGAPGRFERALEIATAAINETPFGERVAVVAFDERADVVAPPGSAADARSALRTLAAGNGGTRYGAMLTKASELATGGAATLVVVTDLQRAGWEGDSTAHVPPSMKIEVRATDVAADNLAVAALGVDEDGVSASVRNTSSRPHDGVVLLSHNGKSVARVQFKVGAETTADVSFPWKPAATGSLTATIEDPAGFPADNSRYAALRGPSAPSVMVVTSKTAPGQYLFRALEATAGERSASLTAQSVSAEQISGSRSRSIAGQSAVVVLSTRNLDRPARDAIVEFVKAGGGVLLVASPDVDPSIVSSMFGWSAGAVSIDPAGRQASLTATDLRHPIFRPFGSLAANLGQVRFQQAWRVLAEDWQVPARFDDGSAAVLERTIGSGRLVLFASDVDRRWNDFPLHPAFVPFVVEAVRYVSARLAPADEFLVARVPAGARPEPGIQQVNGRTIAVNVDARESSAGIMTRAEFLAMIDSTGADGGARQQAKAEQAESRQSLWQYGLMLMLLTLIAESFVGKA
ncbi:MAG: BatA domain-containing protein [Vicinamibacterales bacterium]